MEIVPGSMRALLPPEPPMRFLKEVYFGIVRKAVQAMPLSKCPISPKLELQIEVP